MNRQTPVLPDQYFSKEALQRALDETHNLKSRSTLILLKPSTFLNLAAHGSSQEKANVVKKVLDSGEKFDTVPYLLFKNNGDGTARVVGHEGRHRCKILQPLGDKLIPVIFNSVSGPGPVIRWGSQDDPFDRVNRWPRVLINEDSTDQITFPDSILYPRDPLKVHSMTTPKTLKSWIAKDKLTELHLVKDQYGYIIQDVRKSPIDKRGPGVRGQSFLNKVKSDGEAIKEFEQRVKELTTPQGSAIKKRKVAKIMSKIDQVVDELDSVEAKLEVFARKIKPNKRLKKAIKRRKTHKQISRELKTHGNKLIEMKKKLEGKRADIDKELNKVNKHMDRHRSRIIKHIDRMGIAKQGLNKPAAVE